MELQVTVNVYDHRHGSRQGDIELAVASLIETIHALKDSVMTALTDLQTEVSETKTVQQSAVALIKGFKTALDEAIAAGNPEALTALSAELDATTNELATAVSENTPASTAKR